MASASNIPLSISAARRHSQPGGADLAENFRAVVPKLAMADGAHSLILFFFHLAVATVAALTTIPQRAGRSGSDRSAATEAEVDVVS